MQHLNDILDFDAQKVLHVAPSTPVSEVAAELAQHNIGAVVVMDGHQKLVGIVSERDVVRAAAKSDPAAMTAPVDSVMSREVKTCAPNDDIQSLLAQMNEHRIRHLPVVAEGAVVGITSIRDLMSAALAEMRRQNDDLQDMSDLLADMYAEASSGAEPLEDVA